MIIILTGIIGLLAGILVGSRGQSAISHQNITSDTGKLAKEYKEKAFGPMIKDNSMDLQQCYLNHLKNRPKFSEGLINFTLTIEENGKISDAMITKNEFQDKEIEKCLIGKFQSYYLPAPPLGINRHISHVIAFKSEETALKEAKQRNDKNKLPMTLPLK